MAITVAHLGRSFLPFCASVECLLIRWNSIYPRHRISVGKRVALKFREEQAKHEYLKPNPAKGWIPVDTAQDIGYWFRCGRLRNKTRTSTGQQVMSVACSALSTLHRDGFSFVSFRMRRRPASQQPWLRRTWSNVSLSSNRKRLIKVHCCCVAVESSIQRRIIPAPTSSSVPTSYLRDGRYFRQSSLVAPSVKVRQDGSSKGVSRPLVAQSKRLSGPPVPADWPKEEKLNEWKNERWNRDEQRRRRRLHANSSLIHQSLHVHL